MEAKYSNNAHGYFQFIGAMYERHASQMDRMIMEKDRALLIDTFHFERRNAIIIDPMAINLSDINQPPSRKCPAFSSFCRTSHPTTHNN